MRDLEANYIELLLKKCVYSKSKNLFVAYDKCNKDFISKLIKKAQDEGFEKILIHETDVELEHKLLKELTIEKISSHPYFCNNIWNEAIAKNCVFLMSSTVFPNYFDDIDSDKLASANQTKNKYNNRYFESVMNDSISWTIFGLPNQLWAQKIFPNDSNAYEKLRNLIYSFCLLENNSPIEKWNKYIYIENKKVNYLNNLNIKELIITNNLGTNLRLSLANNYIFRTLEQNHCIENMPSYSIWSTPHKYKVEGIIYGSVPITYRGYNIENYWFKFKKGAVIDYDAQSGKEYLDAFFSENENFKHLGEIAIIDFNSPISRTNIIYNNNLFDENIATHLAFGSAYQNTIKNGINMTKEELDKAGCNVCSKHMDFTIGTNDLMIIAITYDNQKVEIFKNGNFNYELINENSPFLLEKELFENN